MEQLRPRFEDCSADDPLELRAEGQSATGYSDVQAWMINGVGTAVGMAQKFTETGIDLGMRPVRWEADSASSVELGILGVDHLGHTFTRPRAINDAGTAVGVSQTFDSAGQALEVRAVRWDSDSTSPIQLGALQTNLGRATEHDALAINNTGAAVGIGWERNVAGDFLGMVPIRWDGTVAHELQRFADWGEAWAINDLGFAVGMATRVTDDGFPLGRQAVYWKPDGTVVDLNSLIDPDSGWRLAYAFSISDNGWVAGYGDFYPSTFPNDGPYYRAFLMQIPVPEPGSAVLASIGGILLSGFFLKNRRQVYHPSFLEEKSSPPTAIVTAEGTSVASRRAGGPSFA